MNGKVNQIKSKASEGEQTPSVLTVARDGWVSLAAKQLYVDMFYN